MQEKFSAVEFTLQEWVQREPYLGEISTSSKIKIKVRTCRKIINRTITPKFVCPLFKLKSRWLPAIQSIWLLECNIGKQQQFCNQWINLLLILLALTSCFGSSGSFCFIFFRSSSLTVLFNLWFNAYASAIFLLHSLLAESWGTTETK